MSHSKCKVIFFGTPEAAVPALEALIKASAKGGFCDVVAVVTQPDKPVGRHHSTHVPCPIKIAAQSHKIEILEGFNGLKGISADLGVLVAYGEILPKWLLEHFPLGIVNIHPSLLPKYRGPSPVQAAILNRDSETGISIIKLDEQTDHGPIIAQAVVSLRVSRSETKQSYSRDKDGLSDDHLNHDDKIASSLPLASLGVAPRNDNMTAGELQNLLFRKGAELLIKVLPDYIAGRLTLRPQDEARASYTKKLTKDDGKIDWSRSAEEIEAHIRAMNPWPRAWTMWKGKRLVVWKATLAPPPTPSSPRRGLVFEEVQLEGNKNMAFTEFLRGHQDFEISMSSRGAAAAC